MSAEGGGDPQAAIGMPGAPELTPLGQSPGLTGTGSVSATSEADFKALLVSIDPQLVTKYMAKLSEVGITVIDAVPDTPAEMCAAAGLLYGDAVRVVRACERVRGGRSSPVIGGLISTSAPESVRPKVPVPPLPVVMNDIVGFGIPDANCKLLG